MTHSGHGQGDRPDGSAARGDSWIPDSPAPGQPWGEPWGPQPDATMNLAPVPPESPADPVDSDTRLLRPVQGPGPEGDATRVIPPVQGHGQGPGSPDDATRFIPPVAPQGPAEDATRYLPPVPPQGSPDDATRYIPPVQGPGPQGSPGDATRYIPPVPPEDTAFERFFRSEETRDHRVREEREEERQRASQLAVMGAVVVACAVLGLGLSAAIYGGDDAGPDTSPPVSAAAPAPAASAPVKPSPDASSSPSPSPKPSDEEEEKEEDGPARTQAEALDRLLADSNNSRDAVVRSVANIRRCQELGRAATDLRGAAEQRRTLVGRLGGLAVDRLPRGQELTAALTEAWRLSAAADDHYAAWAEQVQGERGCRDGRARTTERALEGNRASGDATAAKRQASGMWNAIAKDHDLTTRGANQL
ncbi:hypothetical protein ACWDR0_34840 [Streptomyces sp. NPDC003691]